MKKLQVQCVCKTCRAELCKKTKEKDGCMMTPFQGTIHLYSGLHSSIPLYKQTPTSLLGFVHLVYSLPPPPPPALPLAARCSGEVVKNEGFLG